ncbi:LuxR C-terminal-related transcriptional regulator [Streptomyces sp. NPDC012616]|uniref:LuxR C-terminal-related transcriptional regulator n=1 Tax=Streptomyces sp. NPDC012616 TaxID=3364840 RepID=UPI0036E9E58D
MTVVTSQGASLPAPLTSFVGRGREQVEIRRRLGAVRLVTLTGAGGVGKTRLALEAAATSVRTFPGGVWLVDLASVRESSAVPGAVAAALGPPDRGSLSVPVQLANHLAGRRGLMVLDNCEHLVDACAELARTLLSVVPELHILATSRETLGVTGEHIFDVAPLPPQEAIDLLRERAVAVRSDFQITDTNRAAVSRLCADLDGLPLAIELAASRLRTLTVGQVANRLEDRFTLLTGGCRAARPHQRTLRAAIDWSWELCTETEQLLWSRLSVFAGGFTLDAAEGVCAGDDIAPGDVLDLLHRLITQSVVLITDTEGLPRYRLLETIRQYGWERLTASGEQERLLLRHRDFHLALAQGVNGRWFGPGQAEDLARLRADHANLLAALDCEGDPRMRLMLASALRYHWCAGGFLGEGRRQFERALAAAPERTPARAWALPFAAWVAQMQGDPTAARRWLDEADALGEQLDEPAVRAWVLGLRGLAAQYRGRIEEAVSGYEEAATAFTALGDELEAVSWLSAVAQAQAYAGQARAVETGRKAAAVAEAHGERWGRAHVLRAMGYQAWVCGDVDTAGELTRDALECMRGFNDYAALGLTLEHLAWVTASAGEHLRAGRLLGAAGTLWRHIGTSLSAFFPQVIGHHQRCEEAVVGAVGRAAYARALAEGARHAAPAEAVDLALSATGEPATPAASSGRLTRREREVAELVAKGLSNKQIASAFGRSPRTVDNHVQNILAKLGFASRSQIATWSTANQPPPSGPE